MNNVVIRVENLAKQYRLGKNLAGYGSLRESLVQGFKGFKIGRVRHGKAETIWALKDVSFEVNKGQVMGIIGRNGAGKSTLLKILTRITKPTSGRAVVRGRIGSLLEVGTGFHPELTGRENIYLSGAILGMKRKEIERKFEEIVAFSEIDKFLDTPVKRYSSGMYVRLAFGVAAHLEPEVLLIDEVLAVGDIAFQKKCLGKMDDVAKKGRTVLFVSHNMAAVDRLCDKSIYLDKGKIIYFGDTHKTIQTYLEDVHSIGTNIKINVGSYDLRSAPRGGVITNASTKVLCSLIITDVHGKPRDVVRCGESVRFDIEYKYEKSIIKPTFGILISNDSHGRLAFVQTLIQAGNIDVLPPKGNLICTIPNLPLAPGKYLLSLGVSSGGIQLDWIEDMVELLVEGADFFGTGKLPLSTHGPLLIKADWETPSSSFNL